MSHFRIDDEDHSNFPQFHWARRMRTRHAGWDKSKYINRWLFFSRLPFIFNLSSVKPHPSITHTILQVSIHQLTLALDLVWEVIRGPSIARLFSVLGRSITRYSQCGVCYPSMLVVTNANTHEQKQIEAQYYVSQTMVILLPQRLNRQVVQVS